jgi:hypothetical protein
MSIASLLLAFAPALAARLNPLPELEAENERLKAELEGVRIALAVVQRSFERLLAERDQCRALADHFNRLELERNDLLLLGGQHAVAARQNNALAAYQQQQMAIAQYAQNDWDALGFVNRDFAQHCDCSPSRAAALGALGAHGYDGHAGAGEDAP